MNIAKEDLDNDGRPTTARSTGSSDVGSRISLRSLFHKKKIYPIVADVMYGTDEIQDKKVNKFVSETGIKPKEIEMENEFKSQSYLLRLFFRLKDAWIAQHELDHKKDPEFFIKTTLKNLFIYIVFLILLMIACLGQGSSNLYYMKTAITDNIVNYKFADNSGSFQTIANMEDFWKYVEQPLMATLYWNTWYNMNKNGTLTKKNLIYYDDKLVGVPRMRLLRVKANSCLVAPVFQSQTYGCYDQYTTQNSDKSSFGPANDTAWIYSSNGSSYSFPGSIASYESGGYMQNLGRDIGSSSAIISYLKQNLWLNHSTRAVFIDFTFYNANVDLFCIVKLLFEFPATGGAITSNEIRATKLMRYVNAFDYFVLCCEVAVILLLIYYVIEELIEMRKYGIKYFVQMWNLIDIFVVMISLSCIALNFYRYSLARSRINLLISRSDQYVDFDFSSYWQKIYNEAVAINIFLSWIKIYKYISFNKTLTQLADTLSSSMKDLIGFVIMFVIVFFAFSQLAYLLLSSNVQDYRTFETAVFALFRIIIGDFTFNEIYNSNKFLGPLFFVTYIFFVFFVLMNMFFAIINESYIENKNRIDKMKDTYHVAQYLKNQIVGRLKRDKVTKIEEILNKSDIKNVEELTFDMWRNELLKHGYADVEIQALFVKYDNDGDRVLDYDERNNMLQDMKSRRIDPTDTTGSVDEDTSSTNEDINFVTEDQMKDLAERINVVETGLFDIVQKIDRVLEFLAISEKAKLNHQQNIRYSLAILKGSNASILT